MSNRTYFQLPIDADEGFPQAFRLNFNNTNYQIVLYANVQEGVPPDATGFYSLPVTGAFMVMRVLREDPTGTTVILQRKLIPNQEYEAADVAFLFTQVRVSKNNLNGAGSFGSQVTGGIANRWA